jgi:hypothetical protein
MHELHRRQLAGLASELGVSAGATLRLAREVSHNAALASVDLLTDGQLRELIAALEHVRAKTPVELAFQ